MANRTVKVLGWGKGTASLVATLDGETVFSGKVDLAEFNDNNASEKNAPTLFTFQLPVNFGGTKPMKITVAGAPVRFGQIVANYTEVEFGEIYYTGPYDFADISPMVDSRGTQDPRGNVCIDGATQLVERNGSTGTWHWTIDPGSTFEYDLIVKAGSELEF